MITINLNPPPPQVVDALTYEPGSGVFLWKATSGKARKGCIAGSICAAGYRVVRVMGRAYLAHRLAWFFGYGEWPLQQVDHRNRDKADNRLANLRLATAAEQSANRAPYGDLPKGVRLEPSGRYRASIKYRGKTAHLGVFDSKDEAAAAYAAAACRLFGEFARAA